MHQLALILAAKGTPDDEQMMSIYPQWREKLNAQPSIPDFLNKVLIDETPTEAIDLISRLLDFEPDKRITAREALDHPFFADIVK